MSHSPPAHPPAPTFFLPSFGRRGLRWGPVQGEHWVPGVFLTMRFLSVPTLAVDTRLAGRERMSSELSGG